MDSQHFGKSAQLPQSDKMAVNQTMTIWTEDCQIAQLIVFPVLIDVMNLKNRGMFIISTSQAISREKSSFSKA
jgi:hypothetical protein